MTDAGRIGFVVRGNYSDNETYNFLDIVFYGNSSYIAKKLTKGKKPTENNEYWQVLAKTPASTVTGIKGAKETDFRIGNINLTPENLGAAPCQSVHNGDFNNITKPGLYAMTGNPVNGPVSGDNHCLSLLVLENVESQAVHQLAILEAEEIPYVRFGVPSISVWNSWKKIGLDVDNVGSATQPTYFKNGVPEACTYTLGASVPSNAKFTDTVYTHPTTAGNKHIPSGGSSGQILRWSSSGTAVWGDEYQSDYIHPDTILCNAAPKENPQFSNSLSLNRLSSSKIGTNSTAFGYNVTASGNSSHAEGWLTEATTNYSHAEGCQTCAEGSASHAEGDQTLATGKASHAEGGVTDSSGNYSHSEGYATAAIGETSHAEGYNTTASNYASHSSGKHNKAMNTGAANNTKSGDAFVIGNGSSSSSLSNAFRVTFAGVTYGLSSFNSSGADYAEFIKPWYDNNEENEDRIGYFVTLKEDGLHKANEGDYIAGITSGNPSIVGNADEDYYWRYERDEFNRFVWIDVEEEIPKTDENNHIVLDEENHPIMIKTGNIIKNGDIKLSSDYDSSQQNNYVERKDRKEWDYVGMLGVLPVRDDGTCLPGQYCKCGNEGIATFASKRDFDTFFVIERINDHVISVILK